MFAFISYVVKSNAVIGNDGIMREVTSIKLSSGSVMTRSARQFCYLLILGLLVVATGHCEEPVEVTVCQLKGDPPAYNHRVVRVTGFVSHAFEDFTIFDASCPDWPGIWLEYGGERKSGTMYCCGVTADRTRPKELVVEDTPIPLLVDDQFEAFDKTIQPPFRSPGRGSVIHATLIGRFFAGRRIGFFKGKPWGGYGHMGCCTLLAIEQVISVDAQNRSELDYGAASDQPDIGEKGCGYQFLMPLERTNSEIQWQRDADEGRNAFAFDDPLRVASEALASVANVNVPSREDLKLTREAQGREVFEYRPPGKPENYMVVVSRPYLSSFYARDPARVAWVATAAYRSSCKGKNSVTRLK